MSKRLERHRVGELRPSQLLFTFGVGSTIELPHLSVVQMGLDDWDSLRCPEVEEPRLVRAVQRLLKRPVARLRRPPPQPDSDSPEAQRVGVPVTLLPRWLRCPTCQIIAPVDSGIFVIRPNPYRPDRTRYVHENCLKNRLRQPPTVLAARYMVACEKGHLEDFPWDYFVHQGRDCPGPLRVFEVGVSGSNNELFVRCDCCESQRALASAFEKPSPLGACRGLHSHLRHREEDCKSPVRPLLVGASNSWFPIRISVLSIPNLKDPLLELVQVHIDSLRECESEREVNLVKKAIPALNPYPAAEIFARLKQPEPATVTAIAEGIREPEWRLFCQPSKAPTNRDLTLREVKVPSGFEPWLQQVVLADRLREVHGLVGFTRLESPEEFGDPDEIPDDRKVPLSRGKLDWVPAVEIRGEGIFIRIRDQVLKKWGQQGAVLRRENALFRAHQNWRRMRRLPAPDRGFPGIQYALIHSLAHALMRQLTLECGYAASSLRERIYFSEGDEGGVEMAGVLIYTAAPDCDGTLGGLVSLGDSDTLGHHLRQALEQMRLCSSDPLCADHVPDQSGLDVHGASCHACLFSPETSCERGNRYLDRCLLIDTLSGLDLAFFAPQEAGPFEEEVPISTLIPEPVLLPVGQGLPVYKAEDLSQPQGSRPSKESDPSLFWMQIPDDSLNKIIPQGTWCLFRRLSAQDPRPSDDTLCVVETPEGNVVRRFFYIEQEDNNKDPLGAKVLLRARTTGTVRTIELQVAQKDWAEWRPLAQFAGLEDSDES